MSGSSDQLAEVYKQVESYFRDHPVISVQPTKGDPPDQYAITYKMAGFQQTPEGDVVESNKHVVELSIPFGFPHFPPSCKPKSEIFHPDFDPAAICLGDIWEQDASLANVILYIGKMINGESFSQKNAFNDQAGQWYKENSNRFPLNAIAWGGDLDTKPAQTDETIDILGEEDLSADFDLSLDSGPEVESSGSVFSDVTPEEQADLDYLEQLKFQKRFNELSKKLRSVTELSVEQEELKELANQELQKCKSLYREAKNLENLGSAAKALKRFEVVQSTVSDYPSIQADINRVRQTIDLLSDLDPDQFEGPHQASEAEATEDAKLEKKSNGEEKPEAEKPKRKRDSFFDDSEQKSRLATIGAVGLGLIGIAGIGVYYFQAGSMLEQSAQSFNRCEASLAASQFKQAQKTCEDSKELLDKIFVFHQSEANSLRTRIDSILLSEKLRNGLEGKILFDGMYLSKQQATEFKKLKEMVGEADALYKKGKWEKAREKYTLLQEKSGLVKTFSPALLEEIEEKKYLSKFQISLDSVNKFIEEEQWHLAVGSLSHSQSLLSGLPEDERAVYKERLKNALSRCKFEIALKNANSAFDRGRWQDAIMSYEACLELAHSYSAITDEQIKSLTNAIDSSKLYLTIERGNNAFANGQWNEAIEAYRDASNALSSNQTLLDEAKTDINRKKLGKIILQASIIRDKQTVKSQLENKKLHEAGKLYNQILASIEGSTYSGDKEFVKAKKEIHSTLEDLNQKIYITEKETYLKEHYRSLFVSNYPAAVRENLTQPVITFVKEVSGKLLFRMQCTEKRRNSRPLTLVMFYAYDKRNGQWELSTENQDG